MRCRMLCLCQRMDSLVQSASRSRPSSQVVDRQNKQTPCSTRSLPARDSDRCWKFCWYLLISFYWTNFKVYNEGKTDKASKCYSLLETWLVKLWITIDEGASCHAVVGRSRSEVWLALEFRLWRFRCLSWSPLSKCFIRFSHERRSPSHSAPLIPEWDDIWWYPCCTNQADTSMVAAVSAQYQCFIYSFSYSEAYSPQDISCKCKALQMRCLLLSQRASGPSQISQVDSICETLQMYGSCFWSFFAPPKKWMAKVCVVLTIGLLYFLGFSPEKWRGHYHWEPDTRRGRASWLGRSALRDSTRSICRPPPGISELHNKKT